MQPRARRRLALGGVACLLAAAALGSIAVSRRRARSAVYPDPEPPGAPGEVRSLEMSLDCAAAPRRIHELVYGIGAAQDRQGDDEWWSSASARRWGGNPTTRYNWRLGNAWNAGSDWYFENLDYVGTPGYSYREFIARNRAHGMKTALTLPLIGWVAKDSAAFGFPRWHFPEQDQFDPQRPAAGNGMLHGQPLPAADPSLTSVPAPPSFIEAWVETIRHEAGASGRSVDQYILDNEPNLWNSTHRDLRSEPLGYDELLERTISYGSAVRRADPAAVIAGPAEWGWMNYFYSAKDSVLSTWIPLDRLWHGGTPLIPWYLRKLAEHERTTGVRVLDVLDLHFYPQTDESLAPRNPRATSLRRIRATRGLWDPTYVDESWISEPIQMLPRMKRWIAENYPGRGISLGEWCFGADDQMSGGLAHAAALGIFGTQDVSSAFHWAFPMRGSPAGWAHRAFRNFDDQGGRFEDWSVPARSAPGGMLFASRDRAGVHWVLIALNLDPERAAALSIALGSCVKPGSVRAFAYAGAPEGLVRVAIERDRQHVALQIEPFSIAVVELRAD